MSVQYKPILWDRSKMVYDAVLIASVTAFLFLYLRIAPELADWSKPVDYPIQRMRAFGTCAFLMLTLVLCIGPMARLNPSFLPLLYNRRHFGVLTATIAAAHAVFVLDWYFNFSPTPRYDAVLLSNTSYGQALGFPFEAFGVFALGVLIILAVTSHDFWLSFLSPPLWKAIHMSVYLAYAAVVAHVTFGYLQSERAPLMTGVVFGGAALVTALHVIAATLERRVEDESPRDLVDGWVPAGDARAIPEGRAKVIALPDGERVAIWRHGGKLSALSNVCAHQNGPLGEGRIIDGCVTCPWHGHQFRPEDGCAPAPFTDRVATYPLYLDERGLWVYAVANPLGTKVEPLLAPDAAETPEAAP